ncbi:MAG: LuxR C-terminal-related transcriptional regulator [Gammaproteobacteria bacterium]|nr:LuxR C-terminal-related transcriptional regulator [Gammaproteobacteria bacterium]
MLDITPTVYIVHQEEVTNSLIKQLLNSVNISSVDYQNPEDFLFNLPVTPPSCFLFDFFLPEMNGLQLMAKLKQMGIHKPCLFMSSREDVKLIIKAMNQGAYAFVKRPFNHIEFIDLIQKAIEKDCKTQPLVKSALNYRKNIENLSQREKQILILLTEGKSAIAIGKLLNISHRTVENHRIKIFEKLNLSKTTDLIRQATIEETLSVCELV